VEAPASAGAAELFHLLHIIEAVIVGMPDVHLRIGERLAVFRAERAVDVSRLAFHIAVDVIAHFAIGHLRGPERAEHGRLRHVAMHGVIDGIDQGRNAQRVRQQHEFLPYVVADLPRAGEEVDRIAPLLFGGADVADEIMQMLHQRRADFLDPRIGGVGETLDHCRRNAVFVKFTHGAIVLRFFD
jgi:hypothetical protein